MKMINYFPVLSLLAGVLAAPLFFSCAKNEVADLGDSIQNPIVDTEPDGEGSEPEIPETPDDPTLIPQEGEMTEDGRPVVMYFGVRIDNGEGDEEGTKTHLGDLSEGTDDQGKTYYYYPNFWTAGDQVKINNTASATLPSENIYEGGKQARFPMAEVVSKYNGNWYVGYPAAQFSFSNGTGTVTVPSVQTYVSGSYDPSAYILLGKSASQSVRFYPQMAVVRFTPQDAEPSYGSNIKNVRIEAIGEEAMSGKFTTDYNNGSATFSPVDGQSYPYVQIDAPNQSTGLAFGTQFFFLIPAKTYADGIRFVITTVDGKSMSVSKAGAYTASVSTTSTIKPPKYVPSTVTLTSPLQWTSSAILSWTGGNSANDFKKAWRLAVYSNSACNSLVVSHDIPADPDKSAHWKDVDGSTIMTQPRFAVTGLNPGTHYWCKVTDISNNVSSEVLEITTESFTRVTAASPSGSTLLAEDFSEIAVGTVWSNCAAGWTPANSAAEVANSLSLAAPTGVVTTGYYQEATYATNNLSSKYDFTTAPRFNAGWGFVKDGDALTIYPQAGFLRVGGKNSSRTMIVCPQLTGITTGKYATVDVTLKIAQCVSADVANNDLAVFIESDLTLDNSASRVFSGATYTRAYPLGISASWRSSETATVRINGLSKTDRLMIGAYRNVTNYNRFFLYQVKVEKVSESSTELFDITDDVSLRTFYARVSGGETGLNANVRNDVTASSTTASGWAPLNGYTGTLEGNDNTITGLTKPFFADLQGTVQNLTLNSTVSSTDRALNNDALAIFAETLTGGTISYCTSAGSVTYTPSEAINNGTRDVAGLVGYAASGLISHCTNSANISVPSNSVANDAILEAGGLVARLGNGSTSNVSCEYLINNGSISVAMDASGSHNLRSSFGGVIAYVVNQNSTSPPDLNNLTNNGPVQFSGKTGGQLMVGGVVGYVHESSKSTGSVWKNSSSVTVTSAARVATNKDINVGGLAGILGFALSNSTNEGVVSNEGTFSGTKADICVGGVAGNNKGKAVTNCKNETTGSIANSGKVSNSGAGNIIAVGGLVGWSGGSSSYSSTCYNKGAVLNTGNGAETTAGVRIGGLVGCTDGSNNLSGGNY
ncbi:MAG: hypothetical protein J6T35_03820, partial [Bacteroidales bacterium]|nr:hypothetical protein [Bacteroidales bacterium]